MTTAEILSAAKKVKAYAAALDTDTKNRALELMAQELISHTDEILAANAEDLLAAKGKISEVMTDRLRLDEKRIRAMADGLLYVAKLEDPSGREIERYERADGLLIKKVSVPIGVIAIIYESRPNVTADAAALILKSGNVCILRGGKEAFRSSMAIVKALRAALEKAHLPSELINMIEDTTRVGAEELMCAEGYVDLLIPRGGAGLIRACTQNAKVPCIQTGTGICHIYVDSEADEKKALDIIENAKMSRPSVCNACEVCLVHKDIAKSFLPKLRARLVTERKGVKAEMRLDECAAVIIEGKAAGSGDFDTEFLDYILAVGIVDSASDAIAHIAKHSTGHSEAIITENKDTARLFCTSVDSAAVYVNASTRFTDGGEFGLGCEMGISTQKLHARGPMGLRELNTYKYVIEGNGHIR